jgi:RecJ-like exonuclease
MKDYYDAVPPEDKPKMKECPRCLGKGHFLVDDCPACDGTGEVPMAREDFLSEKDYQRDSKIEEERIKGR